MATEFDLILYGATGFTGRLAAQYLLRPGIGDQLRIAIAGRNEQKLVAVQLACQIKPAIVIADSTQPSSIEAMVQKTNVVLSLAGPFALYGEVVVAACAKWGRDYLDITGETPFIRTMLERYQQQALTTGARLIPFSGFDSIPADLATYLGLAAVRSKGLQLDEMYFYYQIKGGFNGGTLATALNMAEQPSRQLLNANSLILDSAWPKSTPSTFKPYFEPALQRWSAPFFMDPINKAVVRRSAWLRAEAGQVDHDFQYAERMLMPKRFGWLQAVLTLATLAGFRMLSSCAFGRRLLRRIGPKPGEGPSAATREQGFFRGQLVCRSQGECKLVVRMERNGDPGNEITVALAGEAARLAAERKFLSERKGFLTPSVAFGDILVKRLETAGFRFAIKFV